MCEIAVLLDAHSLPDIANLSMALSRLLMYCGQDV